LLPRRPSEVERFFTLSYEARVQQVKELYRHEVKKQYIGDWYSADVDTIQRGLRTNFRPYFDVIMAYAETLSPPSVMQLGSYAMVEGIWLQLGGYKGRFIASDYDPAHLRYLEASLRGGPFAATEFRVVDLERPQEEDFADVAMVVALAVLSNIQPEGIERLFRTIERGSVECMIIGDMYVKRSLSTDPTDAGRSWPLSSVRNWCHPYMALARKHGFEAFFLPDFTYSSYLEARGIFVIHRGISLDVQESAIRSAMRRYIERQPDIWAAYTTDTYPGLEAQDQE
jgi:hypothetical protein